MAYFPTNVLDNQIKALPTIASASGSIANFTTDKAENLVECEVQIVATGGGGTPTTPIAINGFTGANVSACGINCFDGQFTSGYYWGGNVGDTIAKTAHGSRACSTNLIPVKPNTTYYFTGSSQSGGNYYWWFCDSNGKILGSSEAWKGGGQTFTTPNNCTRFAFTISANDTPTDLGINYPSTNTTRYAYNGTTHTISFGQTVYGGSLDVLSGKLTITHGYITYNSSTGFIEHTSGRFYKAELPTGLDFANRTESISNVATYLDQWNTYGGYFSFDSSGIYINKVSASETLTDFNTRLSNTPFQVLYPLASATVMQLDSEEVNAIVGTNNVYSDTGNITDLEYKITVGLAIS